MIFMKTFNITEIKNYILSQDSMGDILYNLSEASIDKANVNVTTFDKKELQRDYEAIENFDGDWGKGEVQYYPKRIACQY